MKTKLLFAVASLLGAIAVIWMGVDFIGSNALALAVTVVIGFVYGMGLFELVQFRAATGSLREALGGLNHGGEIQLDSWLQQLHPSLVNAVAQRIEGERVGLPAPVFTPYLVGLLVMLGLLGTFVGMVDTLQGAVIALEGSTELNAIRAGLAAPIQGLGLAFGTSVAGVAASAMLGLNSTLSRRERMLATRELDRQINGVFREHSLAHNRQQTYQAMQRQSEALPDVAKKLASMAGELERMGQSLSTQLLDNQQQFHAQTREQYLSLAESVDQSLRKSLAESGRLAGESIAPVVEKTMAQMADDSRNTQKQLLSTSEAHLADVSAQMKQNATELVAELGNTGKGLAEGARLESAGLVEEIGRLLASTEALVEQRATNEASWLETQGQRMESLTGALREELTALREAEAARSGKVGEQLDKLQSSTSENLQQLQNSTSENLQHLQNITSENLQGLSSNTSDKLHSLQSDTVENLESLQKSTVTNIHELQNNTQENLQRIQTATAENMTMLQSTSRDQLGELQTTLTTSLDSLEATTAQHLGGLEARAAEQLATLGRELEQPMTRLIETASETPRAAAEVIGKLREEVSNNIERDNSMLEERQRILQDLATLSESLQQASQGQQQAIAEMVDSSAGVLKSVSEEFREHLSGEASRLSDITANAAGSAAEIASLGEAFSLAVQLFSDSNNQLVDNLSRIEQSMETSTERSDEQMSYYVAQAREIIDQSMLSQREIIEELRRLGQTGDLFSAEAS